MDNKTIKHLKELEAESIYVLREVAAQFERPVILFSGGKDSIVIISRLQGFLSGKDSIPAVAHRHGT